MAYYRFQVSLGMLNALPEDNIVNVWHAFDAAPPGDADDVQAALAAQEFGDFYNGLAGLMPESLVSEAGAAHSVKYYELTQNAAGGDDDVVTLLGEHFFSTPVVAAAVNPPLPPEVACCLSMAADPEEVPEFAGATRPRARRRARVYLGPWTCVVGTTINVAGGQVYVHNTLGTTILNYAEALIDSIRPLGFSLACYSRSDNQMRAVTELHVDNAFDTVRSRGTAPTARQSRFNVDVP